MYVDPVTGELIEDIEVELYQDEWDSSYDHIPYDYH